MTSQRQWCLQTNTNTNSIDFYLFGFWSNPNPISVSIFALKTRKGPIQIAGRARESSPSSVSTFGASSFVFKIIRDAMQFAAARLIASNLHQMGPTLCSGHASAHQPLGRTGMVVVVGGGPTQAWSLFLAPSACRASYLGHAIWLAGPGLTASAGRPKCKVSNSSL